MHVMAQLGSGSFGEVYTALWKSSKGEVRVAVKYFNSKLIGKDSNFDREVCDKKNISLALPSSSKSHFTCGSAKYSVYVALRH